MMTARRIRRWSQCSGHAAGTRNTLGAVENREVFWLGAWAVGLMVTAALMGLMWIFGKDGELFGSCVVVGIMAASSVWAAWDSNGICVRRYRTQMANEPVVVLFLCMTIWPVAFPWYVIVRQGIRAGLVPLK